MTRKEKQLALAISIAAELHKEQSDKGGEAYILHPIEVMRMVAPDRTDMILAILHDVKEDCDCEGVNFDQFGSEIVLCLDILTRREGESYQDYIERVASHPRTRRVKKKDLKHNMDTGRLPIGDIGESDYRRWDKYRKALVRLERGD